MHFEVPGKENKPPHKRIGTLELTNKNGMVTWDFQYQINYRLRSIDTTKLSYSFSKTLTEYKKAEIKSSDYCLLSCHPKRFATWFMDVLEKHVELEK